MKNFNDVINSVGEAINNAAQSGNIEEMLNKTKAYAKRAPRLSRFPVKE